MSTRLRHFDASVVAREELSAHLVRLTLDVGDFPGSGVPDEWVGLIVPGQFQSRYYTVRALDGGQMTVDVVVHRDGLVTEWVRGDIVGSGVTLTEPKGSFAMPPKAGWLLLVGDLTGLPAMARIIEHVQATRPVPVRAWAEVPEALPGYLPEVAEVIWLTPPGPDRSALSAVVEGIDWPSGPGYFWMGGESSQMRAIRKHLMHDRGLPSTAYDVMGYWRGASRTDGGGPR